METYELIVLVALFVGVVGIIAILERRRRAELVQFTQYHETLTACLDSLQAIQTSIGATAETTRTGVIRAVDQAAVKLSGVGQTSTHELLERLEWLAKQMTSIAKASSKEIQTEAQCTTKAIEALKVSLEESVKITQASSNEIQAEAQRTTKAIEALKISLEESVKF